MLLLQRFRRDLAPVGKVFRDVIAFFILAVLIERFVKSLAVFATAHAGFVDGDLDEPGAEFGFGAELIKTGQTLHQRVLRRVFGIGFIAQNGIGRRVNALLVRLDELVEQITLAGLDAADEFFLLRGQAGLGGAHCYGRGTRTAAQSGRATCGNRPNPRHTPGLSSSP